LRSGSITAEEIHVFIAFTDAYTGDARLEACRQLLQPHELARASLFHFERDRVRHIVTRWLARSVLARYVGVAAEALRFEQNVYGRPKLDSEAHPETSIRFNISHTDGVVVLAVTSGAEVGIDVENVIARPAALDVAERFFAPDEAARLRSVPMPARSRAFFEYWTLKESYIKARGKGLSLDLGKFAFHFPNDRSIALHVHPDLDDAGERWRFWQFEAPPEYLFALCAECTGTLPQRLTFTRVIPQQAHQELLPCLIRLPVEGAVEDHQRERVGICLR